MMPTIGVTGHRFLADVDRLLAGLDEVIQRLEEVLPSPWTVISALAEGADRLVARHLLSHGANRLVAVLPLPQHDYETDFTGAESRAEFAQLLARADEVVEIPAQPSRDAAYAEGGLAMLDRADVLIAVWDGREARGLGGTAEVVGEARRRGLPVAWIHAGNRRPRTRQLITLATEEGRVTLERFPGASPKATR